MICDEYKWYKKSCFKIIEAVKELYENSILSTVLIVPKSTSVRIYIPVFLK